MSLRFVPSANKAAGAVCSLLSSEPFAHVQSAARCLGVELTADGPELARSQVDGEIFEPKIFCRWSVRGERSVERRQTHWEVVNLGFLIIKSA